MAKILTKNRQFNTFIRTTIIETIQEVFRDPDLGLEIQKWVQERLKKEPKRLVPFNDIKKKYR